VQHAFAAQSLHHLVGDEFVVLRRTHLFAHRFECGEESGEIAVLTKLLDGAGWSEVNFRYVFVAAIRRRRERFGVPFR